MKPKIKYLSPPRPVKSSESLKSASYQEENPSNDTDVNIDQDIPTIFGTELFAPMLDDPDGKQITVKSIIPSVQLQTRTWTGTSETTKTSRILETRD